MSEGNSNQAATLQIPRKTRIKWAVIILTLMVMCRYYSVLPVFRDTLQDYLHIGDQLYGLMFSIGLVGGLVMVLPGGYMVDRRGPLSVIRLAIPGVAAAFLIIALAGMSWWTIGLALALGQMMIRPLGISVNSFLVQLFPHVKRRIISLNFVAMSGGEFIFPALAEVLLLTAQKNEKVTFAMVLHIPFALMACALVAGSLIFVSRIPFATKPEKSPKNIISGFHFRPQTWFLIFLAGAHALFDSMLFYWWARFLDSDAFADQPVAPGFIMSGFAVAYFTSRMSLAMLPENFWRRRLMVLPGILGGLTLIAGILSQNYLITGIAYILGGLIWSAEFPTFVSRIAEESRDKFGAAIGLQQMLGAGLTAVGITCIGFLVDFVGEPAMWSVMLIPAFGFVVLGMAGLVWTLKYGKPA